MVHACKDSLKGWSVFEQMGKVMNREELKIPSAFANEVRNSSIRFSLNIT